ncbi:hypothetical protein E2C01_038653 [Portunus trituberculatus]|uniref:Uncharacterized protein n=1 Tax=Portunus trituberculatus TaxID=210409 RepID=A0A5B7FCS2_PORTR|nr:hypothetical protein [Portunus trituberculatus]
MGSVCHVGRCFVALLPIVIASRLCPTTNFYVFWRVLKTVLRGGRLLPVSLNLPLCHGSCRNVCAGWKRRWAGFLFFSPLPLVWFPDPGFTGKWFPAGNERYYAEAGVGQTSWCRRLPWAEQVASMSQFLGQDTKVSICHTAPMPGGQTPICDIDGGVCHMAPMPGGQSPFQEVEAGFCHTAAMPGGQLMIPSHGLGIGVGVCPLAPMPGGYPLPRNDLGHVDPGESVQDSLPLIQKTSVEAGQPAPVPGGSGMG